MTAAPQREHGPVDRAPAAGLRAELQVAMALTGHRTLAELGPHALAQPTAAD